MAVLNQGRRMLKQEAGFRDLRIVGVMANASKEVIRQRGLRMEDPQTQQMTLRSLAQQAADLSRGASAQAGDLGRVG
eukprot:6314820-Lingulodinium_polyedra.AAC.1